MQAQQHHISITPVPGAARAAGPAPSATSPSGLRAPAEPPRWLCPAQHRVQGSGAAGAHPQPARARSLSCQHLLQRHRRARADRFKATGLWLSTRVQRMALFIKVRLWARKTVQGTESPIGSKLTASRQHTSSSAHMQQRLGGKIQAEFKMEIQRGPAGEKSTHK